MKALLFVAVLAFCGAPAYAQDAVIVHHDAPPVVVDHPADPPTVVEHRSEDSRDCSTKTVRRQDDTTGSSTTVKKSDCN
ncbi:MAG TPA: hypothetical protein VG271_16640 [Beijerinckiaceae bacterium]|jgi:hypothetical protein|nr:hypothetical protein [Beijerinckiaceae bacterium]